MVKWWWRHQRRTIGDGSVLTENLQQLQPDVLKAVMEQVERGLVLLGLVALLCNVADAIQVEVDQLVVVFGEQWRLIQRGELFADFQKFGTDSAGVIEKRFLRAQAFYLVLGLG